MSPTQAKRPAHAPPRDERRSAAIAAHRSGQLALAAGIYDALLRDNANDPELLHLRAQLDHQIGEPQRAAKRLRRAIQLKPGIAAYHLELGSVLLALGRIEEAVEQTIVAAEIAPNHLACWFNLGNMHYAAGAKAQACAAFQRAVEIDPNHAQANNNLGLLRQELGQTDAARENFRQALRSNPRYALAANNLGALYDAEGDAAAAESWFEAAMNIDHAYLEPVLNLAASLEKRGAWSDAIQLLRRARMLAPQNVRALWNLALNLLRTGAFAEGWALYEHGIGVAEFRGPARPFATRPFAGTPRRALLWTEQGVGDQILYASMIGDLVARGIGGTVEVDARLMPILARSFPTFSFIARRDPPDATTAASFDLAMPLASLGGWLRAELAQFPRHQGYLKADRDASMRLAAKYRGGDDVALVGVSWRSAARLDAGAKSSDLGDWGPILRCPGTRAVSLQYGSDSASVARARAALNCGMIDDPEIDQLRDLDAFAAQLKAMDFVITTSSTTAHLAGALGVPGLVLLPATRGLHWYWMVEGDNSPWYPTLRLLRQTTPGDWRDVIARAGDRLAEHIAATKRSAT